MASNRRNCFFLKMCDFIGSIVCPNKVPYNRRTNISNTCRVYMLWIVLTAIFLTAGLVHGLRKFYQRETIPVPDRMYYVDWISTTYCDSVDVTTKWPLTVSAYLLHRDEASKEACRQSTQTIASVARTEIPAKGIHTIKLFLREGDRISAKICMLNDGKIYMFSRKMDFLRCIGSDSWTVCGQVGPSRWEIDSGCKEYSNFDKPWIFPPKDISKTGYYYFVFYNLVATFNYVSAQFTKPEANSVLQRQVIKPCRDTSLCQFDLGSINSGPKAVCFEAVRHLELSGDRDIGKDVRVSCSPRLWIYFMLFAFIPVVIGIVGSVLICKCCHKRSSPPVNDYNQRNSGAGASSDPRYTPTQNQQVSRDLYRNSLAIHGENLDTDEDNLNQIWRNLEQYQESDPHPDPTRQAFSDPPPPYDEVMKGTFV